MREIRNVRVITLAAMLTAVAVILGFFKIPITSLIEIRFQSIPVKLAGMLMGPFVGGTVGILTDVLSYLVRPTGAFFPGFTITSLVTGVIFALFLYKKPFSMFRVAMAELTTGLLCSMLLNTLWLSILYKTPYLTTFMARLPKELVMLPINILIICLVSKAVHGLAEHFLEPVRSRKQ